MHPWPDDVVAGHRRGHLSLQLIASSTFPSIGPEAEQLNVLRQFQYCLTPSCWCLWE